jgi:hypothetical protein
MKRIDFTGDRTYKAQAETNSHKGFMCTANGCPMAGSRQNEGDSGWFCSAHIGRDSILWGEISFRLNKMKALQRACEVAIKYPMGMPQATAEIVAESLYALMLDAGLRLSEKDQAQQHSSKNRVAFLGGKIMHSIINSASAGMGQKTISVKRDDEFTKINGGMLAALEAVQSQMHREF